MSEWNLWKSIEVTLQIQRILCVSPFYLDQQTGKLKSCWMIKLYSAAVTLAILSVMYTAVFNWNYTDMFVQLIPSGMVWRILCYYAIASINVHFILSTIITAIGNNQQMEFLEKLKEIDEQFRTDFNASVDHKDYKQKLFYAISLFYIYFGIRLIIIVYFNYTFGIEFWVLSVGLIMYSLQYLILSTQLCALANYVFLIESRYRLTHTAYQRLYRDYNRYLKLEIVDKNIENAFAMKLLNIFELFRKITRVITLYDDTFGWMFANQILKTFMTVLMQVYVVFLTISDAKLHENTLSISATFIYGLVGEGLKLLLIIVALQTTYATVNVHFNE